MDTPQSLTILKTELTTDPLVRGYAGMTHAQAANDLNAKSRPGQAGVDQLRTYFLLERRDGETSADIARKLDLTEARISQLLKQITCTMAASLILVWAVPSVTVAQTPPCLTATWETNTEPDLGGYHLTLTEDGVVHPVLTYPATATKSDCLPKHNAEYEIALTAFDTSGNESDPSTVQKDLKPPAIPTGLQITINVTVTVP